MILSQGTEIDEEDLPEEIRDYHEELAHEESRSSVRSFAHRRPVREL